MNKFIFLDRDGTLNVDIGHAHNPKDLEFYPDVFKALNSLKKHFKFIIITNQPGISYGYFTEKDFHNFNNALINRLHKEGIKIEASYFCPHSKEDNCDCRKPNTKFIKHAAKEFDIDLKNSWVIGDHGSDVQLGKNVGCRTIYLLTGHGAKHREEAELLKPDFIANSLLEAAQNILNSK